MIEKGLYPYKENMPKFLVAPIRASRWKRFFQGVTAIRPNIVNLCYKCYINTEEHYTEMKGRRVDFSPKAINALYGLNNYEIEHVIFKNLKERDLQEALEKVA